MGKKTWRFVNPKNPSEVITVQDQVSATTLRNILHKDSHEKWIIEELTPSDPNSLQVASAQHSGEKAERRNEKRHHASFRVILVSGSSSFRTTSIDVSNGGMRLSQKLPVSFLEKNCLAYISSLDSHESIELICKVVGDPTDLQRISFIDPTPDSLNRLKEWILKQKKA